MTNGTKTTTLREVIDRVLNNSKRIEGFPNYIISVSAKIYKFKSGKLKIISLHKTKRGYFRVFLKDKDGYKNRYVHVIYQKTFPELELPKHLTEEVIEPIKPNKLNSEQVKEILELRSDGVGYRSIAKEYNVSHTQIRRICEKENWQDV